ncbi:MAG: RluA family pseudouridine synthase [Chloroflexi bacterium]|nr:RluA family pseudouridine synthase [Chloroflexota bacterium]
MERIALTVAAGDPRRLDQYLAGAVPGLSRSAAQRLIRDGSVQVNQAVVTRPAELLSSGDSVSALLPEPAKGRAVPAAVDLSIAYEDEWLIIVDKPAGLPVHPGAGHRADTLINGLLAIRPQIGSVGPDPERPGIVHRLDKDTSGLIVVAKTPEAFERLADIVKGRTILRRYTVLVWGRVTPEGGIIDAPIGRHPRRRQEQAITASGRPARTGYRVLRYLPTTSLLLCTLQTGRMHQIRVHLAAMGYPVVGDVAYGRKGFGLKRQFLHASYLAFDHPFTGERLETESPLPADLRAALHLAEEAS